MCTSVASTVAEALSTLEPGGEGVVRVFESGTKLAFDVGLGADARENMYDDPNATDASQKWLGSFGFRPSPDNRVRAGGGVTSGHIIDEETLGAKFVERVLSKAGKRARLPPLHAGTPFVIAFQSNEPELRPNTVLSKLTGPRLWAPPARPAPIVPKFEAARRRDWEPLLKEWRYVGPSEIRFPSHGAFGDETATWANDVSGVMVLHDSDTLLQWLPNPFAADAIADPRLLGIGFPFEMMGAPSPGVDK